MNLKDLRKLEQKIEKTMDRLERMQQQHIKETGQRHVMPIYSDRPMWARRGK